ncbi:MAG: primosomal protein N' [Bacteroidetes bacterium]|nr:primosomal protein N' [Bacteroidota bacterium]
MQLDFEDSSNTFYAEVILPLPLAGTFTYRISKEMLPLAAIGARVLVPFGKGKIYTGIIFSIHNNAPEGFHVHYIQEVIDKDEILITPSQIKSWQWIAEYYMSPLGEVMNVAMPAGLNFHSLTFVELNPEIYWQDESLNKEEEHLMTIIETHKKISIKELEKEMRSKSSLLKQIRSLYMRDLILLSDEIRQKYKPKTETIIKVAETFKNEEFARTQIDILYKKAQKQYELLLTLMGQPKREATKSFLENEKDFSPSQIKSLEAKNLVVIEKRQVSRIDSKNLKPSDLPKLTDFQQTALTEIENHWKSKEVVLLKAPTSGGKTLIYTHLIKKEIEKGKQVLMLVPEIALTQQLVQRLAEYFADNLYITHSKYDTNARTEVWLKVRSGSPMLVVGPRSAVLLPFQKLGLVIVDEEHESTFKQFDKMPRFNGRDLAIKTAVDASAKVLLGSATPSVESAYMAKQGKWAWVSYNQKFDNVAPVEIEFASLSSSVKQQGKKSFFTDKLDKKIRTTTDAHKQVLLFQNRKGYVPLIECGNCGWTPRCVSCDISLTYYKYSNDLRCHYCGYTQKAVTKCEACGSNDMRIFGYGTERIEEETALRYPYLKVKRFDQDSVRGKDAHEKIINRFEKGEIDILVGTQMIIKGIDFSNVGLSAVVSADQMLNFPDFRAGERTFQMLVQLAGRVGRRDGQGSMLIQTGQPQNPLFNFIQNYDYEGLYKHEIEIRKTLIYPPFVRLIRITIRHKDNATANHAADHFAQMLKTNLGSRVLGPEQPLVSRIKNYYLRNILVKLDPQKDPIAKIKTWMVEKSRQLTDIDLYKATTIVFDVDPQ